MRYKNYILSKGDRVKLKADGMRSGVVTNNDILSIVRARK